MILRTQFSLTPRRPRGRNLPQKIFFRNLRRFRALNIRFDIADPPSVFYFTFFQKKFQKFFQYFKNFKNIFAKWIPDSD